MNSLVRVKPVESKIAPIAPRLRAFSGDEPATKNTAIRAHGLVKTYRKNRLEVPVLKGVEFSAEQGKITAIVGQSGSGKSTLLHLLATLDRPDAGEIHFEGRRIDNLSRNRRDQFRNREIGMIFQFYHLLPELTTLENVLAPLMIGMGWWSWLWSRSTAREEASELLATVGLGHRLHHKPSELSGGEMQRAAIARALIGKPKLLLADEPTGNLDQETGNGVLELLQKINRDEGLTIVLVTHDEKLAMQCDRIVRLVQGHVESVD
jgi:lipoprotein-releasing system ATP-binding protein